MKNETSKAFILLSVFCVLGLPIAPIQAEVAPPPKCSLSASVVFKSQEMKKGAFGITIPTPNTWTITIDVTNRAETDLTVYPVGLLTETYQTPTNLIAYSHAICPETLASNFSEIVSPFFEIQNIRQDGQVEGHHLPACVVPYKQLHAPLKGTVSGVSSTRKLKNSLIANETEKMWEVFVLEENSVAQIQWDAHGTWTFSENIRDSDEFHVYLFGPLISLSQDSIKNSYIFISKMTRSSKNEKNMWTLRNADLVMAKGLRTRETPETAHLRLFLQSLLENERRKDNAEQNKD